MRSLVIFFLRLYQRMLAPLVGPVCRFYPTCSHYAIEAVEQYGVFKGGGLALWRLLRCGPWSKGGYDPIPPNSPSATEERTKALL
ncbi:MAG: membrane protein insertion efficiency factor YidD [bacterium]